MTADLKVHPVAPEHHALEDCVRVVARADDLREISEPSVAAVIWQRQPVRHFQHWLDGMDPGCLPKARVILRPADVHAFVARVCRVSETPAGPARAQFADDVARQAELMARIMEAPFLRLRLDVVTGNACRKFHVDAVPARLVCTYRGTGTEYGFSTGGEDPAEIFTVPTGCPVFFRGIQWRETPPSGLVHRSPPIEGTGETRLLLVLDPIFDPEGES